MRYLGLKYFKMDMGGSPIYSSFDDQRSVYEYLTGQPALPHKGAFVLRSYGR
jgi:hypothetical protein